MFEPTLEVQQASVNLLRTRKNCAEGLTSHEELVHFVAALEAAVAKEALETGVPINKVRCNAHAWVEQEGFNYV